MKIIVPLVMAICFIMIGCSQSGNNQQLQAKIDSLQQKLNTAYKPGLGEFMMGIQEHHAKLWFAGINKNWALADFEVHEIGESLEDIKQYCTDRPEVKSIGIINPAIESINKAIKQKSVEQFKN